MTICLIIDESHKTVPQVRAMYVGDQSRKTTLVDYGFRLPSAKDNRPLNFDEFESKLDQVLFVSATPGDYEAEHELLRAVADHPPDRAAGSGGRGASGGGTD